MKNDKKLLTVMLQVLALRSASSARERVTLELYIVSAHSTLHHKAVPGMQSQNVGVSLSFS